MARDRFTFFGSFRSALQCLPREQRLDLYEAIIDYALEDIEPDFDGVLMGFFLAFQPNIDSATKSQDAGRKGGQRKAANAATRKTPSPPAYDEQVPQDAESYPPTEHISRVVPNGATEKNSTNKNKNKKKNMEREYGKGEGVGSGGAPPTPDAPGGAAPARVSFIPPTVGEVRDYAAQYAERYAAEHDGVALTPIDAEHFVSYYEANGWRVGHNKMRDWRATIRNWMLRDRKNARTNGPPPEEHKSTPPANTAIPERPMRIPFLETEEEYEASMREWDAEYGETANGGMK